jgi:hypothetical protein
MKMRFLKLLLLAALVTLGCNLSRPDVDATATQAAADLSGTQTALAPTATPIPTLVPTETEAPTATASPEPTDPPIPEFTGTPETTLEPEPEVILFDDFSNPDEAVWVAEDFSDPTLESITTVDGRVRLETRYSTEDFFGIAQITYHDLPQDFAVTVEIEFTEGSSEAGEAGLLIRLTPDFTADYEFTITPDGFFAVYKYTDEFNALVDYTASAAVRTGTGAVNQLTVLAEGPQMTFLVNGETLVTVNDDDIHGAWLGLIVYNFDEVGAGAYFDNLLVTNLSAYEVDPPQVP